MKDQPFTPENKYKPWNAIHFKAVCMLTVDEDIEQDEVMEFMIPALGQIGLLKQGDQCHATRVGNTLIISKSSNYIDLEIEDKAN